MKNIYSSLKSFFFNPLKSFVLIGLFFGSLIIFISLPLTGADEEAHFTRAYAISEGDFRLYDSLQVSVPQSFRQTIGCFQLKTDDPGAMYQYDYSSYGDNKKNSFNCALSIPLNKDRAETVNTTAQGHSPLSYIPQTLAILIGKFFNLPIVVMIYLVRFFVLMSYIFMISLAIKLLPIRKWFLIGISLLPIPFISLINPGADYIIFGSISIIISIIVRSILIPPNQLKKENKILLLILAIASLMVIAPKGIFPGILIVPLIIFYGGLKNSFFTKLSIIFLSITLGFVWQIYGINMNLTTMGTGANSIVDFPRAFFDTMFTRWVDTDFIYSGDRVGNIPDPNNRLGMPALVVTIINVLLAVYLFVQYPEKYKFNISKKQVNYLVILSSIASLLIIVGSFATIFVGAASLQPELDAIRGVQTRYLFPAYIILCILPFRRIFYIKKESELAKIVLIGSFICLSTLVIIMALSSKWWNPLSII